MTKSFFCLSLHIVTDFVQILIKLCDLYWTAPDYSTSLQKTKAYRYSDWLPKK
ncbi:hypothetical protein [Acinetobacter soli]|uniref:hypothetical protein n=1 Tax=Acinetobacter soli TaxID=487316 RepID=UPI003AACACBB